MADPVSVGSAVRRRARPWSQYFDIVAVVSGDDPGRVTFDDESRRLAHERRPLGQDIVVAVKR